MGVCRDETLLADDACIRNFIENSVGASGHQFFVMAMMYGLTRRPVVYSSRHPPFSREVTASFRAESDSGLRGQGRQETIHTRHWHNGLLKNKVENRGIFFRREKLSSNHHVDHAFHHVLTIKLPPQNAHFSENPLQKRQFSLAKKILQEVTPNGD
jgi:hypothetical protein